MTDGSPAPSRLRTLAGHPALAAAGAFAACFLVMCAISWPMPLYLEDWHLFTMFGDSHVWVFDFLARHLGRGEIPLETAEVGYPQSRPFRMIAWGPALLALPLRLFLNPLGAANLLQLASMPASAVAAWALLRRWTTADPWLCAALATTYGLCPTLLSSYAMGEISNTQGWIIPGFLWLLDKAASDRRWWPALVLGTLASVFTSPYYGMALPLLYGVWAFGRVFLPGQRGARLGPAMRRAAIVGGLVVVGMLPSRPYYAVHQEVMHNAVFRPARHAKGGFHLMNPSPVSSPGDLLWQSPFEPEHLRAALHVSYLGLPALFLLLCASVLPRPQPRPGRRAGFVLLIGGAVLAMGPRLTWDGDFARWNGRTVPLPVAALEALNYPTKDGGLYFRYAVIAQLGLAVATAATLAPLRRGLALAGALAVVQAADAVRSTGPLWPRPGEPLAGRNALLALRGDDGAVLELPLQGPTDSVAGQEALLRAVYHGRPTTSLPRDVLPTETILPSLLYAAMQEEDVPAALRALGFRYVLVSQVLASTLDADEQALLLKLGEPSVDDAVRVWDLGPPPERTYNPAEGHGEGGP